MNDDQINAAIAEAIDADPHWKCAKDYCNDLNAMKLAEDTLTDNQIEVMAFWIAHICELGKYWRATARERAEAFL